MTPTSVSQVYEAMIRVVFGLGGAYLMLKKTGSLVYAAAGGIFGVTAGCIVAVIYLRRTSTVWQLMPRGMVILWQTAT